MSARHLHVERIVDSDDSVAAALNDVSVTALIASVVQFTGDPSYLRGPIRPRRFIQNEFQGDLTADEQAQLRRDALKAICAWRDSGGPPVAPPDVHVIREVMDWIACEPVPTDNAALYAEEMDLAAENPRRIALDSKSTVPPDFSVLIIGLGAGGLLAAIRIQEAGIPYLVIEKNADVGGTWVENSYPGCRVDVASHFYSYSFEPNDHFSDYYTRQHELHRYFRDIMKARDIDKSVRWGCEVERAQWDEDRSSWTVTARDRDGSSETFTSNALISAVGILNRPMIPDLPGLTEIGGPVFH